MKNFKGKAIYNPSGKAGEYAEWACNFYVGCSNGCEYCYCKKGRSKAIFGGDTPTLKKCFRNKTHALEVFEKELKVNLPELQKHGLFFSFTTDPMLLETSELTFDAITLCCEHQVPVKVLTKRIDLFGCFFGSFMKTAYSPPMYLAKKYIAWGFTLTGHDEMEPGASTNAERIEAMRKLCKSGFKTFASIEPIIDLDSSYGMIIHTLPFCNLYKIGLQSGRKYNQRELHGFLSNVLTMACYAADRKVYFKDSFLKQAGIDRYTLPKNCVSRDYNMFGQ